jgi:hypothetical protein
MRIAHLRALLVRLCHLQESPHRTALAFAIGIFIAFSPTYGLHTLSVLFCAWAFRLNALALMAGSLINNPWTLVPILGATLWVGGQVTGWPDAPAVDWGELSVTAFYQQLKPYAVPFVAGGLLLSTIGAAISYPLAYLAIMGYRRRYGQVVDSQLPPETELH